MSMYRGQVAGPGGAGGEIVISVPVQSDRAVTGWIVMGGQPNHATAGFGGLRVGSEILASGRNRREGTPGKVFDLEVDLTAELQPDGKSVVGEVTALLNVPEAVRLDPDALAAVTQLWPFRAQIYAGEPLVRPPGVAEELIFEPEEVAPVEVAGYWGRVPGWIKGGAAAIGVAYVAAKAYKRLKTKQKKR